ncbi:MAG: hypothetical protein ACRC2T_12225 [Thermoguttaceae bacterium]
MTKIKLLEEIQNEIVEAEKLDETTPGKKAAKEGLIQMLGNALKFNYQDLRTFHKQYKESRSLYIKDWL